MTTVVRVGVCLSVCLAFGCGAPEPTPPPVVEAESVPSPDAGAGTVLTTRGKPVKLPSETRLEFQLMDPVQVVEAL